MKKTTLIFITFQLIFIFLYIYKENKFIQLFYDKQKNEKILKELEIQKQNIYRTFLAMQNPNEIKKFAGNSLKMEKIELNKVNVINNEYQT